MRGTTCIDTRYLSISEVVRALTGIIYMDDYVEADLHGRLDDLSKNAQEELEL